MFQYKIIHHIIFTNTDFEQNEKKKPVFFCPCFIVLENQLRWRNWPASVQSFSIVYYAYAKGFDYQTGLADNIFAPFRRGDDLNNCFIIYRKVLRKDNAWANQGLGPVPVYHVSLGRTGYP